jgi:nitroreductase
MMLEMYLEHIKPPSRFTSGNITESNLLKLVEAARWAPSADNQQVWRFIVAEDQRIKVAIQKAIEEQDPRLRSSPAADPLPLTAKELDRMRWNFIPSNYDPKTDSFSEDLKERFHADCACAETACVLIICTFQSLFTGRAFGELELGGAVLNLYLIADRLGYRARIIRNFDRDLVRLACKIPEAVQIPVIIAIGVPLSEETGSIINKKNEEERVKEGISLVDLDRRSVRDYIDKPIPEDHLSRFQHLQNLLPKFTQQEFINLQFITDANKLQRIGKQARIVFVKQKQVGKAAAVAAITYKVAGASGFYGKLDVGMLFQAILMEAYALGIGACWIGAFHHGSTREILQFPKEWRIEGLITMGYPKEYPQPPPRLPIASLAFRDIWDAPLADQNSSTFAKAGITSLIRRNFKSTDAKSILRERDAGQPLVAGFREAYELRVSRGKMV